MQLLLAIVCAVVGAWLFVGGIANANARRMNAGIDFVALQKELSAIGYPAASA